jgi:hypothetical protein
VETLQNWEKVMYLNMYGCDKYNAQYEGASEQHCPHNEALGWLAVFYFVVVVIIGAILLPTLLVALITSCMQIASGDIKYLVCVDHFNCFISSFPLFRDTE